MSTHKEMALALIGCLETHNVDSVRDFLDEDFTIVVGPSTFGPVTLPKEKMIEMIEGLGATFDEGAGPKLTVDAVHEIKGDKLLVIQSHSYGISKLGTVWKRDEIWFSEITADGKKLKGMREIVDSKAMVDFLAAEAEKKKAQADEA